MRKSYSRKTALSFNGSNLLKLTIACILTTTISLLMFEGESANYAAFAFGLINGLSFPVFSVKPFQKYDYDERALKKALKDLEKVLKDRNDKSK